MPIIGTLVLIWDILKWANDRPGFRMDIKGPEHYRHSVDFFSLTVSIVNGASPLTVHGMRIAKYSSKLHRFLRRHDSVEKIDDRRVEYPKRLVSGAVWSFRLDDGDDFGAEDIAQGGHTVLEVYGSHRRRPVSKSLTVPVLKCR